MRFRALVVATVTVVAACWIGSAAATAATSSTPDLGPNVIVFNPSMAQSQIQATVDTIASQQVNNEFGTQRYALLFEPGSYGSASNPLNFQIGYYTMVAGLGPSPRDVIINGSIDVYNRCLAPGNCVALVNFWRSLSNLTINVNHSYCSPGEFWAVSQAAPMRRVLINGWVTLMDYCTGPSYASGGFIADSEFAQMFVINGSQQQWITRNSVVDNWTNGVWNQVFAGVVGAPAQCFPGVPKGCGPFTTLATSPVTREAPYLYLDSSNSYNVFVPAVQHGSSGTSWSSGSTAGKSISINRFFVAQPSDSVDAINRALATGRNLILTPGVYDLAGSIRVTRPDTIVLGLGFPTLIPTRGNPAVTTSSAKGLLISGVLFDAGPVNSDVLLRLGGDGSQSDHDASDPSGLYDVFFRIGGAGVGKASTALIVNSDNVILDDIWAWRADHGTGVGWTSNTADTGVVVNGDNVTAYGLFVEHFQKYEVIWNGNHGTDVFFQNEMPYDVPSQAAWMEAPGVNGYAAFKIGDGVTSFTGYGMGSYSFFNQGIDIFAERGFEVPDTLPVGSLHDLFTIFLDKVHGKGGITHVVNETGGSSTAANADIVVPVVSFP